MGERVQGRFWKAGALVVIALLIAIGWTQRHHFTPVEVGGMAPDYSASTLTGDVVSLSDYRGKVVVLNVWATWCRPCVTEMPALERAYQALKSEGLEVVAVSVDAEDGGTDGMGNPGGDVAAFMAELGLTFTVLRDPARKVERTFAIIGLPTTIIIDRSGRIARRVLGAAAWDNEQHLGELRQLLAKKT